MTSSFADPWSSRSDSIPATLRFAPSPNGYLHVGHAYSALANERTAKRLGGRLLLRMENIDSERCRPEFEVAIVEDLTWLGIAFEPRPRRQCEHFAAYRSALDSLARRDLVYPCFCSRGGVARIIGSKRDWPRDPDGSPHYPGTCRALPAEERAERAAREPHALRLDMAKALSQASGPLFWREFGESEDERYVRADPARWGDAVLARRDIGASYHIAVTVDDALQGVTDVVRGLDLYDATSLHRLLQDLLAYPAPRYRHHEVLRDKGGDKLSKRTRAQAVRMLRVQGVSPERLRRSLGF